MFGRLGVPGRITGKAGVNARGQGRGSRNLRDAHRGVAGCNPAVVRPLPLAVQPRG